MQVSRQPSANNLEIPAAEPLVEGNRGGITESRHRGHIVASSLTEQSWPIWAPGNGYVSSFICQATSGHSSDCVRRC